MELSNDTTSQLQTKNRQHLRKDSTYRTYAICPLCVFASKQVSQSAQSASKLQGANKHTVNYMQLPLLMSCSQSH